MKKQKSLGQIAYESTSDGGKQNFGPWSKAPDVVRRVHEQMAYAVINEAMKRVKKSIRLFV